MKKTLAAAITSALVIGVASTTFAAANPFSDVPTDHWSFDAVAKLAHEGVIEGYGDNTFRGDAKITRYEMAQMVAKAMTKSNVSAADKATIDKLSAEYATELNNLGVRVSNLEKKVDNVKFGGEARLRADKLDYKTGDNDVTNGHSYFELWATAQINQDWVAKTVFKTTKNTSTGVDGTGNGDGNDTQTDNVYVQGPLFGSKATFGKFDSFSDQGYVLDNRVTGGRLAFDGAKLSTTVTVGRVSDPTTTLANAYAQVINDDTSLSAADKATALSNLEGKSDYQAIEFKYAASPATNINAGYHHAKGVIFKDLFNDENLNIWTAGFDSKLSPVVTLSALYAKSDVDVTGLTDNGYQAQLTYKAADLAKTGSYDIYTAYRKVPFATQLNTTNDYQAGYKGWELGFHYVPAQNIKATVFYRDSKVIDGDNNDLKLVRGQVEFFF